MSNHPTNQDDATRAALIRARYYRQHPNGMDDARRTARNEFILRNYEHPDNLSDEQRNPIIGAYTGKKRNKRKRYKSKRKRNKLNKSKGISLNIKRIKGIKVSVKDIIEKNKFFKNGI